MWNFTYPSLILWHENSMTYVMKSKGELSWHKFNSYLSERVSDFMTDSIAENFPHHLFGLCGCLACLARNSYVWEFSWIWSEIRLVSPAYKNIIHCNKWSASAATRLHIFSIKREWIGHVLYCILLSFLGSSSDYKIHGYGNSQL